MLSIVRLLVVLLVASSGLHASRAAPKTPVREIPRNGGMLLPLAWSAAGASGALPLPAGANRTTSLDGYWNFVTDPSGNLKVGDLASASNIRKALVPGSWQSQFDDLRDYAGVAWYWTSLTVDDLGPDQIVLVHFGAADYRAEVYVNAQIVGSHEGGYLPFEFDVTSRLHPGENQLAVRIADPGAKPDQVEGIKYAEIAHGKQNWYVQTSGPWQSVEIEVRPRMHLGPTRITARADGTFQIEVPAASRSGMDVNCQPEPSCLARNHSKQMILQVDVIGLSRRTLRREPLVCGARVLLVRFGEVQPSQVRRFKLDRNRACLLLPFQRRHDHLRHVRIQRRRTSIYTRVSPIPLLQHRLA